MKFYGALYPVTVGIFVAALLALIAWLVLTGADYPVRPYYHVPIADMINTIHTHVCTEGTVAKITPERDGDTHYKLKDPQGNYVIAEVIPGLQPQGKAPIEGEIATACGISRYDRKHGYPEVHPVEEWR